MSGVRGDFTALPFTACVVFQGAAGFTCFAACAAFAVASVDFAASSSSSATLAAAAAAATAAFTAYSASHWACSFCVHLKGKLKFTCFVFENLTLPSLFAHIYVTFIFPIEGSLKVHLQFVHSSVLRVYIYV